MSPSQIQSAWLLLPVLLLLGEGLTTLLVYRKPGVSPLEVLIIVYYVLKVVWDVMLHVCRVQRTSWTKHYPREVLMTYSYIAVPAIFFQSTFASLASPGGIAWRLLSTAAPAAFLCLYISLVGGSGINAGRVLGQRVRKRREQADRQAE